MTTEKALHTHVLPENETEIKPNECHCCSTKLCRFVANKDNNDYNHHQQQMMPGILVPAFYDRKVNADATVVVVATC